MLHNCCPTEAGATIQNGSKFPQMRYGIDGQRSRDGQVSIVVIGSSVGKIIFVTYGSLHNPGPGKSRTLPSPAIAKNHAHMLISIRAQKAHQKQLMYEPVWIDLSSPEMQHPNLCKNCP